MEECHPARTEQMLVPMTDEIVDVRQPGLDWHERNGVCRVDKQLRPMMAGRSHNIVQGSGFSVLRPREAKRGEVSLWTDRRCQIAEWHASQADAALLLGHQ